MPSRMKIEPELIIHVTRHGVTKVRIPYDDLASERAGRQLEERCAAIIALLSRAASGISVQKPVPLIELPDTPVTHVSSQPHHPRQS